jgi:hypothetical protein
MSTEKERAASAGGQRVPRTPVVWVEVTDRHIEVGCPNDCWRCAAALAVADALGHGAWVDERIVCLPDVAVWAAPPELRAFVPAFDDWHERRRPRPVPFGFRLGAPDSPGGAAWTAAARLGLMPATTDEDQPTRLARLLPGVEATE